MINKKSLCLRLFSINEASKKPQFGLASPIYQVLDETMEIFPDRERQEKRTSNHTAARILDVARTLLQSRGYNGFSYRDVAEQVGIQAATIHYYFPTKGDLAAAIVARYRKQLADRFAAFKRAANSQRHLLELYASLFHATLVDNEQLCLGAMLAAEATTLPPEVLRQTRAFFDDNVAWLTTVFEEAAEAGSLMVKGSPLTQARSVVATLEGAMILARAGGDVGIFNSIAQTLIAQLQAKTPIETR